MSAILVGCNEAPGATKLPTLEGAEDDAADLAEALQSHGGLTQPILLQGQAATAPALRDAVADLRAGLRGDETVLFYFSGHALPVAPERGEEEIFLVTHDFRAERAALDPGRYVSLSWLHEQLYEAPRVGRVLIVLDCCYAGNVIAAGRSPLVINLRRLIDLYRQPGSPQTRGPSDPAFRAYLTATGFNQPAYERDGRGAFTTALLRALRGEEPEALEADGAVSVESLMPYLRRALVGQEPFLDGSLTRQFVLARHRPTPPRERLSAEQRAALVRAKTRDHSGFIASRLASFVGRAEELAAIRAHIDTMRPSGGYVVVTAPAGEGKSSVIARLVADAGVELAIHHFIPFKPGVDYQVNLLLDVMAQIILRHGLPDFYIEGESRPLLANYFAQMLAELQRRGVAETIYIDGLDQIAPDANGTRDLSFLPPQPPAGIVLVLGTRPDDTLQPLRPAQPALRYLLPSLSRDDFELVLERHGVQVAGALVRRLYEALNKNALYLDLAASELASRGPIAPEELVRRIASDPDALFTNAFERLRADRELWRRAIRPLLGTLLVAGEPLSAEALHQITSAPLDEVSDALERLGGLAPSDGKGRFSLFHLKLYDYLRRDGARSAGEGGVSFTQGEQRKFHRDIADWCERYGGGLAAIWRAAPEEGAEQQRRLYARQYYALHLYRADEWERLCAALDGGYGRSKLHSELGVRGFAQDLELGRTMALSAEGEAGRGRLPALWRFCLLRAALASEAAAYDEDLLRLLVRLGRGSEALRVVELIPDLALRAARLTQLGLIVREREGRGEEGQELLLRGVEIARAVEAPADRAAAMLALVRLQLAADDAPRQLADGLVAEAEAVLLSLPAEDEGRDGLLSDAAEVCRTSEYHAVALRLLNAIAAPARRVGELLAFAKRSRKSGDERPSELIEPVLAALAAIEDPGLRAERRLSVIEELLELGGTAAALRTAEVAVVDARVVEATRLRASLLLQAHDSLLALGQAEAAEALLPALRAIDRDLVESPGLEPAVLALLCADSAARGDHAEALSLLAALVKSPFRDIDSSARYLPRPGGLVQANGRRVEPSALVPPRYPGNARFPPRPLPVPVASPIRRLSPSDSLPPALVDYRRRREGLSPDERLRSMLPSILRAGLFEDLFQLAQYSEEAGERDSWLLLLGRALIADGLFSREQVLLLGRAVDDRDDRLKFYGSAIVNLLSCGDEPAAHALLAEAGGARDQLVVRAVVAQGLAEQGQAAAALSWAQPISDLSERDSLYDTIVRELAERGQFAEAEAAAAQIIDLDERDRALDALADELREAGHAEAAWFLAEQFNKRTMRISQYRSVVRTLVEAGTIGPVFDLVARLEDFEATKEVFEELFEEIEDETTFRQALGQCEQVAPDVYRHIVPRLYIADETPFGVLSDITLSPAFFFEFLGSEIEEPPERMGSSDLMSAAALALIFGARAEEELLFGLLSKKFVHPDPEERAQALSAIGSIFSSGNMPAWIMDQFAPRVLPLLRSLDDTSILEALERQDVAAQVAWLQGFARFLLTYNEEARAGWMLDAAIQAIRSRGYPALEFSGYSSLARGLTSARQRDKAHALLVEAGRALERGREELPLADRCDLIAGLVAVDALERARELAEGEPDPGHQAILLVTLARAMANHGRATEARALLLKLVQADDEYWQEYTQVFGRELLLALAELGEAGLALEIWSKQFWALSRQIDVQGYQEVGKELFALACVGGHWPQALALAEQLDGENSEERGRSGLSQEIERVMRALGRQNAGPRRPPQPAAPVLGTPPRAISERDRRVLDKLNGRPSPLDWSLVLPRVSDGNRWPQSPLELLADALARAGQHEQLLDLVRRAWHRAESLPELLPLLRLAEGLVARYPELGMPLGEGFGWASAYLGASSA